MKKTKRDYKAQPAVAEILQAVSRKRGATMAQLVALRGNQPHSIRAILSRLRSRCGIETKLDDGRYRATRQAVRS